MKRLTIFVFLLLSAVACAQNYSFSRLDTVLVQWDPAAETDIAYYTMHFTNQADTNMAVTSKVATWDVVEEPAKWQTKYTLVLPAGSYVLRMTATDTASLTSLFSDPVFITITDPPPLKPRGIILVVKPYADK